MLNKVLLLSCIVFILACTKTNKLVEVPATYPLVKIDEGGGRLGPCEPSICINPSNPQEILVGSILDRVHVSKDGGRSWTNTKLSSPYGVYGDPVVKIDSKGMLYYAHLSNPDGQAYASESFLDRIVVQKSTDGGTTWNEGTYPQGDKTKDQDKHWLYIHPENDVIVMTWTEFDKYGSDSDEHKSRIMFSKSVDRAETWTDPVMVSMQEGKCIDDSKTTEGALPVITEDGAIHVAWSYLDHIYMNSSYDGGKTWNKNDKAIAPQKDGWAFPISGLGRCNGMPILLVDNSDGKYRGNLYLNYGDISEGADDSNVWFVRSTDGGKTWSERKNIHKNDPDRHQFLTWMDVDPMTGYIYIVYYDRSAYSDNRTDVYLAYSMDGGDTFTNQRVTKRPFTPVEKVFFGDYNNISALNGHVRPVWTEYNDGKLSIWTALIEIK